MNRRELLFASATFLAGFAGAGLAANGVAVKRGVDTMLYGSCVPSLVAVNTSAQAIDFLQVDVVMALRGGQERTVELRSGYRDGIARPIAPGATATLRQQLDLSMPRGAACSAIAPLMEEVNAKYPGLKAFSLPSMGEDATRRHIELGVRGAPAEVEPAMAEIRRGIQALGGHLGPPKGDRS